MIVCLAILGSLAQAIEEKISMENEEIIVNTLKNFAAGDKFISYEHHLGTPAMHQEIEDGKFNLTPIRSHQVLLLFFNKQSIMQILLCSSNSNQFIQTASFLSSASLFYS